MSEAVAKEPPEGDALFLAGFFQADKCVPTSSPVFRPGGATDLSFDDIFPDVAFTQIVVERDIGSLQYKKQLLFVARQAFERLIQRGERGPGPAQLIEMGLDRLLQVRISIALVAFEIRVDLPDLAVDPVELFGVDVVQWQYALKDPLGMDPTQGVQKDIELPGIVTDDDQVRWKTAGDQRVKMEVFPCHILRKYRGHTKYGVFCNGVRFIFLAEAGTQPMRQHHSSYTHTALPFNKKCHVRN